MTIDRIFDVLQNDEGGNPFDTTSSRAAIDAILARVAPKDDNVTVDLMGVIVDERKRAFKAGFRAACSLLAEGMGRDTL